jgi:hypothetical protein
MLLARSVDANADEFRPTDRRFLVPVCLFSRPPRDSVCLTAPWHCPTGHLGCLVRYVSPVSTVSVGKVEGLTDVMGCDRQSRFEPVNDGGLRAFTTVNIRRCDFFSGAYQIQPRTGICHVSYLPSKLIHRFKALTKLFGFWETFTDVL